VKISLNWLRDFVTWEETPEELARQLTNSGLNVEGLQPFEIAFPGVVVGEVREVKRHPNADRLTLCQVHDGEQVHSVICGAPNVREGLRVLLARPGARLPGGMHIQKTRIRGEESSGMICSARELGLGADAAGIMELPDETRPGQPADDLYGFHDHVLEIEVTPNRPDWLSHLGVAREVAALRGTKAAPPQVWKARKAQGEQLDLSVEIEDFADCPRYMAHAARGVRVGPSPNFIQNRLRAIGARPINNVVDITNYVMYELGQPLHAFDRAKLDGARIYVRRAKEAPILQTLDGVERKLGVEHLVIADGQGPVAVAGVMGSESSEVDEGTEEVVLESAFFDPLIVRRGARSLGLKSESSYRFEREADWDMVPFAAHRALYLLQKHAGARIVGDWADRQNPDRVAHPGIPLRVAQVNRLLGTELGTSAVASLLQQLQLKVSPLGGARDRSSSAANLMVEIPSFRRDLLAEVDLIEEIARIHGYERIRGQGRFRGGAGGVRRPDDRALLSARRHLASTGYQEIVTSSFCREEDLLRLDLPSDDRRRRPLSVVNARHGGGTLLRTSLLPSLMEVAVRNVNASNALPLRLFQVSKVYLPRNRPPQEAKRPEEKLLPDEPWILQLGLIGLDEAPVGGVPADLLEIKGVVEELAAQLRMPLTLAPGDAVRYLASGQQWRILAAEELPVGAAGAVAPDILAAWDLQLPMVLAEIELSSLEFSRPPLVYRPFSRFPAVKRDLSLLVPDGVAYGEVARLLRESGGELLESLELFDIYKGKGLPDGTVAMGIRLKFRSTAGNLKGETVDKAVMAIVETLAAQLEVRMRG
jgi:phenylalanyl-tRNA synthetase beta chain